MKAKQQAGTGLSFIPLTLVASLVALVSLIFLWPETSKTKIASKSNTDKEIVSTSATPPAKKSIELIAPQKRNSPAQKGLGASLAQSPLPKASSKLSLPKDLNLGEHLIQLKGGEWRLRIMLTLSSEAPEFVRFAGPLKRRLIQMLFFLVHHRAPEALRLPSAEERLRSDLMTRFSNVLKRVDFEIYIDSFNLEEVEFVDE